MVIGTCGHQLTQAESEGFDNYISIMDHDRSGNKVVSYMTVCNECKKIFDKRKLILKNDTEVNDYISGKIKYPDDKDQEEN